MRYYLDTELNGFGGALISLALVAEDDVGRSIFPFSDCPNPKRWVREHVLPALYAGGNPGKVAKEGYGRPPAAFLRNDADLVIVCNWPDHIRHFCQAMKQSPDMILNIPL